MNKRKLIEDAFFLGVFVLLHMIFCSEFHEIAKLQINPSVEDYIRYVLSDTMPWKIEGGEVFSFLRTNLVYELIALFAVKPILVASVEYKKVELLYYGSYTSYIIKYLRRITIRAFFVIGINVVSIYGISELFDIKLDLVNTAALLVFTLMISTLIVVISIVDIALSLFIGRHYIIVLNIGFIGILLLCDMFFPRISFIYYDELSSTLPCFIAHCVISFILILILVVKGNKHEHYYN